MISNDTNGEAPKKNAGAPAENLRRLRALSPQESLGVKTENGLMKPFLQAAVAALVILTALTAIPYAVGKIFPPEAKPVKKSEEASAPVSTPTTTETTPKATPDAAKAPPAKKDINDLLNESGTKTGSPKVNPFDQKGGDLLK